jgi:hypothetical protein
VTLCALVALGMNPNAERTLEAADVVALACAGDRECAMVVPVLWATETGGTFALRPRGGSGFGPLQVLRSRYVTQYDLTDPVDGMRAGWHVYKLKRARARDVRQAFEFYNGSGRAKSYSRHAWAKLRRVRAACEGVPT